MAGTIVVSASMATISLAVATLDGPETVIRSWHGRFWWRDESIEMAFDKFSTRDVKAGSSRTGAFLRCSANLKIIAPAF